MSFSIIVPLVAITSFLMMGQHTTPQNCCSEHTSRSTMALVLILHCIKHTHCVKLLLRPDPTTPSRLTSLDHLSRSFRADVPSRLRTPPEREKILQTSSDRLATHRSTNCADLRRSTLVHRLTNTLTQTRDHQKVGCGCGAESAHTELQKSLRRRERSPKQRSSR